MRKVYSLPRYFSTCAADHIEKVFTHLLNYRSPRPFSPPFVHRPDLAQIPQAKMLV